MHMKRRGAGVAGLGFIVFLIGCQPTSAPQPPGPAAGAPGASTGPQPSGPTAWAPGRRPPPRDSTPTQARTRPARRCLSPTAAFVAMPSTASEARVGREALRQDLADLRGREGRRQVRAARAGRTAQAVGSGLGQGGRRRKPHRRLADGIRPQSQVEKGRLADAAVRGENQGRRPDGPGRLPGRPEVSRGGPASRVYSHRRIFEGRGGRFSFPPNRAFTTGW